MVKSYAQNLQGGWLNEQAQTARQSAAHTFNDASDPLYKRRIADNHKTESERRAENIRAKDNVSENKKMGQRASKTEPTLKPESQRGRHLKAIEPAPSPMGAAIQQGSQTKTQSSTTQENTSMNTQKAWLANHWWHALEKSRKAEAAKPNSPDPVAEQFNDSSSQTTRNPSPGQSPSM